MMLSSKDHAVIVDFMAQLYLKTVEPRTARDVSLEEFMAFMCLEHDADARQRLDAAIAYQKRKQVLMERMGRAIQTSIDFMTVLADLKSWAREMPGEVTGKDDEAKEE